MRQPFQFRSLLSPIALCLLCSCSAIPTSGESNLVPVYAIDERDSGGELHVSLQKMDVDGTAKYGGKQTVYYVSPAVAAQLEANPELLDAYLRKQK